MKKHKSFGLSLRTLSAIMTLLVLVASLPMSVFASDLLELFEGEADGTQSTAEVLQESSPDFYVDPFEVVELREENTKYFRNSDGTYVAAQYDTPVHTLDADGAWQDIDNSLSLSGNE